MACKVGRDDRGSLTQGDETRCYSKLEIQYCVHAREEVGNGEWRGTCQLGRGAQAGVNVLSSRIIMGLLCTLYGKGAISYQAEHFGPQKGRNGESGHAVAAARHRVVAARC